VHARIERTRAQLVLQDLGSANGTFLNGAKVTEAFLKDGDTVSLAGVEAYKVVVEMGEVTSASGRHSAAAIAGASAGKPRFSAEWKTRFDWSDEERGELAELRRRLEERESENRARREQSGQTKKTPVAKPAAPARPAALPAKPAPPPAKPAVPAKPAAATAPAPAAAVPVAAPTPAAPVVPPPIKPAAPPAPAPPAVPQPAPSAPVPPSPPKPEVSARPVAPPLPTPPAPAPPVAVKPAAAPAVKAGGPIVAVRLTGVGFSLEVTQPGEYDLGRSREAALRVDHPTVSRKHARLILSDDRGSVFLQDQGGANGTRHNGQEVTKLARLTDQDTIGIGEVDLKVSLERG
jgi:pSer/pThr/pTyr-binding forkhead associated (FHA) protein